MRHLAFAMLVALLTGGTAAADNALAPGGTLRAGYLASNPAQAVQDRTTGAITGASADLARELGRRVNLPVDIKPLANVAAVIEAVGAGQVDIGFIAYEPSRAATVDFSQTYMLVQQSFLVLDASPIRAIADVDRTGNKIAGTRADSITLFMKRKLKQATLLELENNPAEVKRQLLAKEIDAFGANRQRLTNLTKETPGTRLLPDSLFGVPQTIVIAKGKPEVLTLLNRFLDDVRASGFLKSAIERSGVIGIEAAPGGSWTPTVPD